MCTKIGPSVGPRKLVTVSVSFQTRTGCQLNNSRRHGIECQCEPSFASRELIGHHSPGADEGVAANCSAEEAQDEECRHTLGGCCSCVEDREAEICQEEDVAEKLFSFWEVPVLVVGRWAHTDDRTTPTVVPICATTYYQQCLQTSDMGSSLHDRPNSKAQDEERNTYNLTQANQQSATRHPFDIPIPNVNTSLLQPNSLISSSALPL